MKKTINLTYAGIEFEVLPLYPLRQIRVLGRDAGTDCGGIR